VLASIAPRIGVREARRIVGHATGSMAVVASSRAKAARSIPATGVRSLLEADGAITNRDACLVRAAQSSSPPYSQPAPLPSI
jgi:hypothetical protein